MKRLKVGLLAVSLILLAGCSKGVQMPAAEKDTSKPIIKVNSDVITQNMFDKIYKNVLQGQQANVNANDPKAKFMTLIYKDRIINDLIIRNLISQEVKKQNIVVKNDELTKAIDEIAQKLGGKEKLEATLTLNNVNKSDFIENIKLDLSTKKMIEKVAGANSIGDKEIKDFYEKSKATKFTYPDQVRAEHILVSASPAEIKARVQAENPGLSQNKIDAKVKAELDQAKAKAVKILNEVKANPTKFEAIAKTSSEDPSSAQRGGDLGFFSKDQMVPEFSKVAFSTTPGQIVGPVQTQFGYHIIKVADRKKAGITPFYEVRDEIKQYLADQNKMTVLQKIVVSAKNTSKIVFLDPQYNPANIEKEIKTFVKDKKINLPSKPVQAQ